MDNKDMYREHIIDSYKHPHNFGNLPHPTHACREFNPFCGDDITMQLVVKEGIIEKVTFNGKGCALSVAAASMLTDKIKGMNVEDIKKMSKEDILELLKIPIGPVRLKCALLSLETLHKALER
ncbi:iron-sulfur cluster assembly scaffold protein [Candidatus Woesearchaeota archaeon]|nr:MAG: iron-sulfur cluster assembly scaffold protein [Candidatus Woesearchaeota archaeon]